MKLTQEQQVLSYFLPDNTLEYFDVKSSQKDNNVLHVTLEEKNDPPIEKHHENLSVESLGFQDITITDFPSRGRKTMLTFRRRRWKIAGKIVKRDIPLTAPGTRLEQEFGLFLKGDS